MDGWLVTIAQLPTEDPAARMRVLRTLESLGAAVMREGAYLLPDTAVNRQALEALGEYIVKSAGTAQVLQVSATTPAQHETLRRLFDRSARYDALIKTVESLRVGFGQADPSAISRVLHKQHREFEAIAALDFFPTEARSRAEHALAEADAAVKKLLFTSSQTRLGALWITKKRLQQKNYLIPVSCGASFFQQAVSDFRRIDSYPASRQSAAGQLTGREQSRDGVSSAVSAIP